MADGTAKKWSDEEKYLFLTQAIAQMHARGGSIDLAHFSIPGRTPKALSHLWAKVRKDNEDYTKEFLAKVPATPGGLKRKAPVAEGDNEEPATPVKRPRKTPAKPRVKKHAPAPAAAVEKEAYPPDVRAA
ncbi:hypothetical protein GQX73_g5142 [Xylaria multiplex]|uniref:Myb-like domain-containing protein n=1 Tax=Xylaria multiplex TaxID=323545 RepID=A0A7C8IX25_9PEZI|nr:hypothetical protein GQX73_g5142 [Xylaria multiplex]